ncbi:hypothetical protein PARPLA_00701 [Rhodobacteraceae bacterium THAF1]|uniref:hypothetical protein n=1 Tax=Palleronia sp. THAF1 TaxID=2587842 RepID=UPI000F3F2212|nr:hypothetical protein [Palleronia sp. THAF1]QFU09736.1 hypothetical protein FIU81_13755 [Palleronia sp. THAF1]VDC17361.1 hypothetical protein PARPLA_00701 [Rhodobacteraceae bacterium THAF1]
MRALALGVIGLVIGVGLGVFLAVSQGWEMAGHDHSDPAHHGAGMDHAHDMPLDVSGSDAPSLTVEATPDPMAGWNLYLEPTNFTFAPESASGDHVAGQGHAHVYVDGVKLGRFYGPWVHVPTGGYVQVTLTSNDHRPLAVDGEAVAVDLTLD